MALTLVTLHRIDKDTFKISIETVKNIKALKKTIKKYEDETNPIPFEDLLRKDEPTLSDLLDASVLPNRKRKAKGIGKPPQTIQATKRRNLSPEARERISAAQRKRWAKLRKANKATGKKAKK